MQTTDQQTYDQAFAGIVQSYRTRERNESPVKGCPDCVTPQRGRKVYCDRHRCQFTRRNGKRCSYTIPWGRDYYCTQHGCNRLLAPGVFCNETAGCTEHSRVLATVRA
jgi:hypothetical protein